MTAKPQRRVAGWRRRLDPPADVPADGDSRQEALKWVAGSLAVATTALAAAGLTGAAVTRLVTVHPWWFMGGLLALLLAAVCGVVGLLLGPQVWTGLLGVLLFLGGTAVLVLAHASATGTQQRPTTTLAVSHGDVRYTAEVQVRAEGLRPDQYVFVLLQGQNSKRHLEPDVADFAVADHAIPPGEYSKQRVYKGRIGPDVNGKADVSFAVDFDRRLYEQVVVQAAITDGDGGAELEDDIEFGSEDEKFFPCTSKAPHIACATVLVPAVPESP